MAEPEIVQACVSAMQEATEKPVSVKCRIGVDDMDIDTGLDEFIKKILVLKYSIVTNLIKTIKT